MLLFVLIKLLPKFLASFTTNIFCAFSVSLQFQGSSEKEVLLPLHFLFTVQWNDQFFNVEWVFVCGFSVYGFCFLVQNLNSMYVVALGSCSLLPQQLCKPALPTLLAKHWLLPSPKVVGLSPAQALRGGRSPASSSSPGNSLQPLLSVFPGGVPESWV